MNAKSTIKKFLFITFWCCIGAGMLVLLLAAISKRNKGLCAGYTITIKGVEKNYFLDEKDVEELLRKAAGGPVKGKTISEVNLQQTEKQLEQNTWVSDAELYFDNQDWLHVTIVEKEPVARVFTESGNSFYIDDKGKRMPLSDKLSARVPVFTGFTDKKKLDAADSVWLKGITTTATFILHDPFWMSQVSQVDITKDYGMEMIPVVGNHIIRLGDAENIEKKFHRLFIFYKEVLSKTGFEKYKLIDVRFAGQVVASRNGDNGKFDSVQLRKNVEKLLRESSAITDDTVFHAAPLPQLYHVEADSAQASADGLHDAVADSVQVKPAKPLQAKQVTQAKPGKPKPGLQTRPKPADRGKDNKPKALMPPKPAADANGGYN